MDGEYEVGQDQQDANRLGPGIEIPEKGRRCFRVVKGRQPRNGAQGEQGRAAIAMSLPARSHGVGRSIFGLAVLLLDVVMLTGTTLPLNSEELRPGRRPPEAAGSASPSGC